MQDLDRVKRDFYHQAMDWLRENHAIGQGGLTAISLFIAVVAIIAASYFAFVSNNINEQNFQLLQARDKLNEALFDIEFKESRQVTDTKLELQKIANELINAENNLRSTNNELTRASSNLSQEKDKNSELTKQNNQLTTQLELSQFKVTANKKANQALEQEHARLNSEYILLTTQLNQLLQNKSALTQTDYLNSIKPIWLEASDYFNHQAVLAIYVNQDEALLSFMQKDVEYIYYKIAGVKSASGSEIFRPIEVKDIKRGFYYLVYQPNANDWANKKKQAFIKFKNEETEHVINFY